MKQATARKQLRGSVEGHHLQTKQHLSQYGSGEFIWEIMPIKSLI